MNASEPGFIRVDCPHCKNPDVWFKCNACGRSSDFQITDADGQRTVSCECGASYTHGTCTCGETAPPESLVAVPFSKGPAGLADYEIAWDRIALFGMVAIIFISAAVFLLLGV